MTISRKQVRGLLGALRETRAEELDCDQFLDRMARYAELKASGAPLPEDLQAAQAHERLCANCREECAALLEMLQP